VSASCPLGSVRFRAFDIRRVHGNVIKDFMIFVIRHGTHLQSPLRLAARISLQAWCLQLFQSTYARQLSKACINSCVSVSSAVGEAPEGGERGRGRERERERGRGGEGEGERGRSEGGKIDVSTI